MDDKIDKNSIKNLPTELARKEASTWIKKLISKSQLSPPAVTRNGGFEGNAESRQRKEPAGERTSVARKTSRSVSPTSPIRTRDSTSTRRK